MFKLLLTGEENQKTRGYYYMNNKESSKELLEFVILFNKLVREFHSQKYDSNYTQQQFRTLLYLEEMGKCPLKLLSKQIQVSTSSLCIMLNKLVDEELVYREIDQGDRRNTFYGLTENGLNVLKDEKVLRTNKLSELINKVPEGDREELLSCLTKARHILKDFKIN